MVCCAMLIRQLAGVVWESVLHSLPLCRAHSRTLSFTKSHVAPRLPQTNPNTQTRMSQSMCKYTHTRTHTHIQINKRNQIHAQAPNQWPTWTFFGLFNFQNTYEMVYPMLFPKPHHRCITFQCNASRMLFKFQLKMVISVFVRSSTNLLFNTAYAYKI